MKEFQKMIRKAQFDYASQSDKRSEKVRKFVTIVKVVNGRYERCTHGKELRLLERSIGFDLDKALSLVTENNKNCDGYAVFNHFLQTGYFVKGSFSDMLDSLESRGLIAE